MRFLFLCSHRARASGHRFRVNDITCHPVLPLLLTTSHHNVVNDTDDVDLAVAGHEVSCSELILWRVDSVGPLSKSGGITELARYTTSGQILNAHFRRISKMGVMKTVMTTLWCQLEDMFKLIVMLQGIEKVTIQLIDTPTKVYAIGARLFYQRCP